MRRVLHLISQAHLDPVWLWPQRDGVAETLTTCQSAMDRQAEHPSFRFTRSSAAAYRWIKETDPRLYESIRKAAAEGRWEFVGGWVEQADCNLPSAESFLRQAEYARRFMEADFGAQGRASIGYNPDSFGHCGGLPQLLRLSGMDAYVFMRPEPHDNPDVPLLFWWEGPDGSRVLGCRIPGCYSQSYAATADDIEKAVRAAEQTCFAPGFDVGALWFGVGNHGGGPTREHIARVCELQRDPSLPEIRFSTLRAFLDAALASPAAATLPVRRGELGYVFRGCYAANGEVKRLHRAAEKALFVAESAGAAAGRTPALDDAWWELLNLQFHDILAGTCVATVQDEILHRFGAVQAHARQSALRDAASIARRTDTAGETGSVLFAFNPLPWPRRATIQLDTFRAIHARDEIVALEAPDGAAVPIQWLPADANFGPWGIPWGKLTARVELPACGYRVFRVCTRPVERAEGSRSSPAAGDNANPDATPPTRSGAALDVFPSEKENLLAGSAGCVVVEDTASTWGHGLRAYTKEIGRPTVFSREVLAAGPLVSVVREKARWGASEIWMDVVRWSDTEDVELRLRFNWQERRAQLRLEIPTRLTATSLRAKMPAEIAERPADGSEFPCHDWVVLQGEGAGDRAALAVCNDATYSHSAEGGVLRFALARGVPHAEHPPFEYKDTANAAFLDQGWQERRFLLRALRRGWSAGALTRLAEEFQIPPIVLMDSAHAGDRPREREGLRVEPDSASVLSVRPADAGAAVEVRIQETDGRAVTARLFGPVVGAPIEIELQPRQIATVRLTKKI